MKTYREGNTPLHEASKHGNAEIIKILYDNGALLTIENHDGETPMEFGLKKNVLESTKAFAFLLHWIVFLFAGDKNTYISNLPLYFDVFQLLQNAITIITGSNIFPWNQ